MFLSVSVICGAYYSGEFTGSKMCLLAIEKEEVLHLSICGG